MISVHEEHALFIRYVFLCNDDFFT